MSNTYKTSTGVILGLAGLPYSTLLDIETRFQTQKPQIPEIFIENLGRNEKNPDDPNYQDAMQKWNLDKMATILDFAIIFGVEINEIPEGVEPPEGNRWIKKLRMIGTPVDEEDEDSRKLAWIKTVATPSATDLQKLYEAIGKMVSVPEEDVKK